MEDLKEFIFENKPTESCHASTVLPLDDGRVVAAWFAGTKESADDVDILTSVRSESGWSEPVRVSADSNIPHWNPVLFRRADGKIMLFFKVGKKIPMWKTYFSLSDNGVDWSEPAELVPEDIGGGRGPVKNKPIRLRSGRVIAPASDERNTLWVCFVDISDDDCRTWKRMRTVPTKSLRGFYVPMIQPTLWQSEDGNVHMLTRTSRGRIYRSDSSDEGETWCRAYRTKMPNNNSGIDLVAAIVNSEHDVPFVCHIDIPAAGTILPASGYHLCMRTSVYIYNGRILFIRIHISRFNKAVIDIGYTVCCFDCTDNRHFEPKEWIGSSKQINAFTCLSINDINFSR